MSHTVQHLPTGTPAENYERFFVPAISAPVSGVLLEAAALQPGDRVLDVACGTGVVARLAAERVGPTGAVTAVDASPDMVATARSLAPAIDWRTDDATSLHLPDASFDVVTCQLGLMFFADQPGAVAEMRRVLAPGGRIVISTAGRMQPPFEVLERSLVEQVGPQLGGFVRAVFSLHDPDALAALLDGAGLSDVSTREVTLRLRLPAPAEFLWQYIAATPLAGFVAQARQEQQEALERQVLAGWERHTVDGRLRLDQPVLVVSGRR